MIKLEKFLGTPTLMVAVIASSIAGAAQAAPDAIKADNNQNDSQVIRQLGQDPLRGRSTSLTAQVTSVSQLSDVRTTDWAFTALQSLVERYGCIAGYPDKTYRGQRAMTRYEFAAGLNACLDKVNELITAGLADKVSREDLAALQRLQEEFAAELAALKGRVDKLDAQVAKLEAQQFSTTTKLNADGVFALSSTFNDQPGLRTNTTFSGRIRLNFDTSFSGSDRLRTRLEAGNIANLSNSIPASLGGRMTRLAFDVPNTTNTFNLTKLFYRFPVGNTITGFVSAVGMDIDDVFNTFSPYFESAERGAISRFGRYNPLLFRPINGLGGAGGGVVFNFGPAFAVRGLYIAENATAGNPTGQGGISGGGYAAGAQIQFNASRDLQIGAQYLKVFEPSGSPARLDGTTGSTRSALPVGVADTSSDRYGFLANWNIAPGFGLGGSVGFANARAESGINRGATADVLTWDVKLAFPDLFGRGNLAGIIFGQQPRVTGTNGLPVAISGAESGTAYHLEALYRFQVSKNISITPGLFVVFNPNNNAANNSIVVGTIRTTFSF